MKRILTCIFLIVFVMSMTGCATIMQGTTQSVGISSVPTGATVIVNNVNRGQTPLVVELKRKDHHIVRIEMPGYKPYETTLTRKTSGWVWGNIVFGGLIGLVVDSMSGGLYKLTPEEIHGVLQEEGRGAFYRKDALYIAVVLEPKSSWQKVGQLERVD